MRAHFATIVRTVVLSAAAPFCLAMTALVCLETTTLGAASVDAPAADPADEAAAAPAAKAFDPADMPEAGPSTSPLGYHYAELTPAQTSALRRGFKLPLDALAAAKSPKDLENAVVVAPLPDPNRPLLAVSPTTESLANPFADSNAISFRKDPLRALGALLGAADASPAGSTASAAPATTSEEDDPFGSADAGPAPAAQPAAEVDSEEDPFGSDADSGTEAPEEEDPFGAF